MLERLETWLKVASVVLALLFAGQVAGVLRRVNPLKRTDVPEPASWSATAPTNTTAAGAGSGARSSGTNVAGTGQTGGAKAPRTAGPGAGVPVPAGPVPMGRPPRGMPGAGGPGGGGPSLDPEVQARVDRVIQSELLGMVVRPPPMALLGIVGQDVLLRAPNGMSGLVREGGELGGVRIVRIGTNRVLVSEDGVEKELTIFNGIGGESLLPQSK